METDNTGDVVEGGTGAAAAPVEQGKPLEVDPARKALVKEWLEDVKSAEKHWEDKAFKRMRVCMKLAANGTTDKAAAEGDGEGTSYVVPIVNRLVNMAVAQLYAKNPTAIAKRKPKLMYQLWDGDPASLQQAMVAAMPPTQPGVDPMSGQPTQQPVMDPMTGQPVGGDPNAIALLMEIQQVKNEILMADRMAKTLKLLFAYFLEEQDSGYKEQFKALVRRVKVCGVGYVELDFQRLLRQNPDIAASIADATKQIDSLEALMATAKAGEMEDESAQCEDMRLLVQDLTQKLDVVMREGPILSFPRATEVFPDEDCRHLKTFAGSRFIVRRYDMTCKRIAKVYKVDVEGNCTPYENGKVKSGKSGKNSLCRVYRVQDKENQQVFVVCDGYPDFIVEPAEPDVKIERFWTIFPVVFNEVESDGEDVSIFPPSDVWNARHMQREFNSSAQGLREHKMAARPRWATGNGKMEQPDKDKLKNSAAFEVLELNALMAGEKIGDMLQVVPVPGVDPNLYETETTFRNIQRTVGAQEANLGGTSGDTATETSIAENSRQSGVGSDVDDLDTMLTALARAMGQLLFMEMSKDMVIEICGPGAVWPDAPPTREQVVKDLILEVEAGSSGRPNKAAESADLERAMPWVTIIPGMKPDPWAKKWCDLHDIDAEEAFIQGLPSMTAMNQASGRPDAGGGPNAPDKQGDKGKDNGEKDQQINEPQSQPAMPAPMAQPGPQAPVG